MYIAKRSLRRHHHRRMIARMLTVERWYNRVAPWSEEELLAIARKRAESRAACSCWMGSHTRDLEGPTLQERRAQLKGGE